MAEPSNLSGISGSADIPEPAAGDKPKSLRARWETFKTGARATLAALPRVLKLVWEASPWLTAGLGFASLLMGVIPAATAYIAKLLTNAVVAGIQAHAAGRPTDTQLIVVLAAVQFAIFLLSSTSSAFRNVVQQLLQERVTIRTQLLVMEHAAALDLPFFENPASYDLLRRAQQEAASRPLGMVSGAFGLIQTAITFASMVGLLVAVSPLLAVIALVSPIPAFVSNTRYGWRLYNVARWASPLRRRMEYLTTLVTTDTHAKEVKLFGLGGYFVDRFRLLARAYYERQRSVVTSRYSAGAVWGALTTLASSLTYLYVALQAIAGRLTLGDLTLYTAAASSVQGSIQGLLAGFSGMYENSLYLSNLFELLATPTPVQRPHNPRPLPRPLRGEIVFEDVSFVYPGSQQTALRGLSFRVLPGETVAVVGRNGAGKSTLIKLVCRLYDPSQGRILLDGVDIREFDPAELRSEMAAMFQDYVTYQATAAENVGLGELARIDDRPAVQTAADRAGAGAMIENLPGGYDTPLGKWFEREGANLSGGEWQKVALGRAFMRESRILLLDEPTSGLDAQAEYELFERLRNLTEGRTAIYISHRFSTVRRADRILFLEHGQLVEEGSHAELIALDGRYARLFRMQASAYTGEKVVEAS